MLRVKVKWVPSEDDAPCQAPVAVFLDDFDQGATFDEDYPEIFADGAGIGGESGETFAFDTFSVQIQGGNPLLNLTQNGQINLMSDDQLGSGTEKGPTVAGPCAEYQQCTTGLSLGLGVPEASRNVPCACVASDTEVLTIHGLVPISDIEIGQRVGTENFGLYNQAEPIDPDQWRLLTVVAPSGTQYGGEIVIESLRPLSGLVADPEP